MQPGICAFDSITVGSTNYTKAILNTVFGFAIDQPGDIDDQNDTCNGDEGAECSTYASEVSLPGSLSSV